ncbi:MAG: PDZ domain-containing protein [Planctomycetes bacterium]|nr:PDZ domain-containing protein [Planctomycetota bacterium]MCW8135072.1 PDZ domain-containing protein [Planctomycetota bacterium]
MTRLVCLGAIALFAASLHAEPTAEQLRALLAKYEGNIVSLTWKTKSSAMGQNMETDNSATGVLIGEGGLVILSNQPFANNLAGMAGMFGGRGAAPTNENFALNKAGTPLPAVEALENKDANVRFYGGKGAGNGLALPEKVEVPGIGEQVVVIGAFDATLNFAKFFRLARINAVIEQGKCYGLDGYIADCLGALVVTLDGKVLGVVGQKPGKEEPQGGGIGRMLGGLNDPSKALGNRVLLTPAVFTDSMKQAQAKVKTEGFFEGAVAPDKPATSETSPLFEGTVANATWREKTQDVWVLIDVKSGAVPEKGSKVEIRGSDGRLLHELTITQHYNDITQPNSPVDQIGGALPDPEKKAKIEKGMRVVVMPAKPVAAPKAGWRGIERFMKVDPEILQSSFGGKAKAGFQVSQNPDRDSPTRTAGLRSGDVIIKIGEKSIDEAMDLQAFLKLLSDQKGEVTLTILRRGGEQSEVKVGE